MGLHCWVFGHDLYVKGYIKGKRQRPGGKIIWCKRCDTLISVGNRYWDVYYKKKVTLEGYGD